MKIRKWDLKNEGVVIVTGAEAQKIALKCKVYVCRNRSKFRPSKYIAFYSKRTIMYFSEISQVMDDVDLFRDRCPNSEMTFFEYVKSMMPDLTNDHFEKVFKIKPGNSVRTVFKLKSFWTVGPIENDLRDKNGNRRAFTYGRPRYTTLKSLGSSNVTSQLVHVNITKSAPAVRKNFIRPTEEQEEVIRKFKDGNDILIHAFAGTGKTTTLQFLTKACPKRHFLYIVFNRAASKEAKKRFGDNVNVRTLHSLAFRYMSRLIDMRDFVNNYRIPVVADILNIKYSHARVVKAIFDGFCYSNREKMDEEFASDLFQGNFEMLGLLKTDHIALSKAARYAQKFYKKIEDAKIPVTHNFYLKQFQLLGIADKVNYDAILLDEAQDSNLITYDIVNRMAGQKVVIGDRHQKIYGFRKSLDISGQFLKGNVFELSLTNSFRFHQGIANLANNLLGVFKNENVRILGTASHREITTRAFITRTNAKIIEQIEGLLKVKSKVWKTVRDPKELFKLSLSITKLFTNGNINFDVPHELYFLEKFKDVDELFEYAKKVNDIEMLSAISVAKHKSYCIEKCFTSAVEQYAVKNARVFLTTAHTSKGLEWDEIRLSDDYPDILKYIVESFGNLKSFVDAQSGNVGNRNMRDIIEEINLLYVALTRARERVDANDVENGDKIFSGKPDLMSK